MLSGLGTLQFWLPRVLKSYVFDTRWKGGRQIPAGLARWYSPAGKALLPLFVHLHVPYLLADSMIRPKRE